MKIANKKRFTLVCMFIFMISILFCKGSDVKSAKNKSSKSNSNIVYANSKSQQDEKKPAMASKGKIVIDAGHGAEDFGTSQGNLNEKDLTLKIARYTRDKLQEKGYEVVMTRDADVLHSLAKVGEITNSAQADAFISIHVNSYKTQEGKGIETYYYAPDGFQKEDRAKFAKYVQKAAVKDDSWHDRGIVSKNLAVLRYSKIPCALIECGYISNDDDRKKLEDDKALQNLAMNISGAIENYINDKGSN